MYSQATLKCKASLYFIAYVIHSLHYTELFLYGFSRGLLVPVNYCDILLVFYRTICLEVSYYIKFIRKCRKVVLLGIYSTLILLGNTLNPTKDMMHFLKEQCFVRIMPGTVLFYIRVKRFITWFSFQINLE